MLTFLALFFCIWLTLCVFMHLIYLFYTGLPITRTPDQRFHVLSPTVLDFHTSLIDPACIGVVELLLAVKVRE